MKAPQLVHTGDRVLDDTQKNGRDATKRLNASLFDGARLIDAEVGAPAGTGLSFTAGTARTIAHGLGRRARGWIEVGGPNAASTAPVGLFATSIPSGLTSETHICVTPFFTGTCLLLVF